MKYFLLILLSSLSLIKGNPEQDSFLRYNIEILDQLNTNTCPNPQFYINTANIEESKPENQDKIILYHGEVYGAWLFQMVLKKFKYPEADEYWLPLRYIPLEKDIDRTDLMKLIFNGQLDAWPKYGELGLSVSPNLVSKYNGESAWYMICHANHFSWHRLTGLSVGYSLHSEMYDMLKKEFIPENLWVTFESQMNVIYQFIQIKRTLGYSFSTDIDSLYENLQNLFPETFMEYKFYLKSLPLEIETYNRREKSKSEGVALQIIMDKHLADILTYSSHAHGWVESKKHQKFKKNFSWEGEEIEPYSEFYKDVKNTEDKSQARLAMNLDFRSFPSRVRIKAIAGIMENHTDYEILKSLIKEMVKVNKKKK